MASASAGIMEIDIGGNLAQLKRNVDDTARRVDDYTRRIANNQRDHIKYAQVASDLRRLLGDDLLRNSMSEISFEAIRERLQSTYRDYNSAAHQQKNDAEMRTRDLVLHQKSHQQALIALRKAEKSQKKLSLADLEVQLQQTPFYKTGSLKFLSETSLQYTMQHIWMTPDVNTCMESFPGGKVPLPNIKVTLHLTNNEVIVTCVNGGVTGGGAFMFNSRTRTPHPHILTDGNPCFGDFGGPVTEALAARDFLTVTDILQAYFQVCNTRDSAGKTWRYLLIRGMTDTEIKEYNGGYIINKRCTHPDYTGWRSITVRYASNGKAEWAYNFDMDTWYKPDVTPDFSELRIARERAARIKERIGERRKKLNIAALQGLPAPLGFLSKRERALRDQYNLAA